MSLVVFLSLVDLERLSCFSVFFFSCLDLFWLLFIFKVVEVVFGCFSFLLFCVFFTPCLCVFKSFCSFNEVLQIALRCSSSLWRSFWVFVKVSGCFHECQNVLRCVWSFK